MVSSAEYKNESTDDQFPGIKDLQDNGNNEVIMFVNLVTTSVGTSVNMLFHRRKPTQEDKLIKNHKLQIKDFTTLGEVPTQHQPFFVDPGQKSLYSAASPGFDYGERATSPTSFNILALCK